MFSLRPPHQALLEPFTYITSNPGKEIRGKMIEAFNEWLLVPKEKLAVISRVINMLHSSISQHRFGNIFHNPIKKQDAADYHDIVKRPMDLKTIKARVKDGTISNALEFQRDIYLMFANAMIYNRPGSEIHAMAEEVSAIL